MAKKGKFIVLDGVDGSGKATQVKLLSERLIKEGYKVKTIDFPRYNDNFFGAFIGECLTGKYGNFIEVNPKIASTLYAADRWESSVVIKDWLKRGYIVIADRYVSSNQIHQGGKIRDPKERKEFLQWLDKMEFEVFKISRPEAIIYLQLPIELSFKLIQDRKKAEAEKSRKYLEGKKDLAEEDFKHLAESRESAIKIVRSNNSWIRVDCAKKNEIMTREAIHEKVYEVVKKII
jgi:dTMP kinase